PHLRVPRDHRRRRRGRHRARDRGGDLPQPPLRRRRRSLGAQGLTATMLLYLVWLLPLLGGILLWAFGPQLKSWAGPIGSVMVFLSFGATAVLWRDAALPGGVHVG